MIKPATTDAIPPDICCTDALTAMNDPRFAGAGIAETSAGHRGSHFPSTRHEGDDQAALVPIAPVRARLANEHGGVARARMTKGRAFNLQ